MGYRPLKLYKSGSNLKIMSSQENGKIGSANILNIQGNTYSILCIKIIKSYLNTTVDRGHNNHNKNVKSALSETYGILIRPFTHISVSELIISQLMAIGL